MKAKMISSQKLLGELHQGRVYRREELLGYSRSIDRDLKSLERSGRLQKVGSGLYLYPRHSRWGVLPAEESELAKSFLKTEDFLIVSNNHYNALGLGMSQLWNEARVYNKRRHQKLELGGMRFDFQVPFNGYPKQVTSEFLLVDLMNNLPKCGQSPLTVKEKVVQVAENLNKPLLLKLSQQYGKLATKRYFTQLLDH